MEQDKNLTAEIQQEETLEGAIPPVTFDEFTPPSYEEWKQEVVTALKGGSFEKSMFTKTYEGITLNPIYRLEDQEKITHNKTYPGMESNLRGANAGGYIHKVWTIAQECDGKTPAEANEMVKYELLKGTTAASVVLDTATRKGCDPDKADVKDVADIGVSLATVADVEKLLDGVDLEKFEIDIYAGASNIALLAAVITACEKKGLALEKLHGAITADPIGELALDGELVRPLDEYYDEMAHSIAWAEKNAPQLKTVVVNTDVYHNGGANDVQEVAYAMNEAVTYMRAMERRGIDVNTFCRHLRFHFSIGANFFMEIAKLRSLKMVWAQIVKNCGGDEEAQKINLYVSTSTFCQTKYDPYVNLLRAATQSFSAVVGGMDGMYVKPFDHCIRPSDVFSRRIARNIQIMEQHEFNFIQPIDPSGGSWYIEPLTEEFTEKTWAKFQEIESHGGLLAALESGKVQAAVKAILEERFKNLATRKDRAVGNNMYPNMTEELLEVPEVDFAGILKARKTDMALRTHSQTSGWSLTEQDPFNNITRTCIEAMAAALGHTQSLHTNALDEAIALPTDFSARIARNTQLYIQDETKVCKVIDPWGGSYYVEALTNQLIQKAWAHIQEIEQLGGMSKAIDTGLPKMRIEEAAARRQAHIDSGAEKIVGVNDYRLEKEDPLDILEVDNTAVRLAQIERLKKLRANRDNDEVRRCLDAITHSMETGEGNLLELAVNAARARASKGEISDAVEKVCGRHKAIIRSISGVYSSEFADEDVIKEVRQMTDDFEQREGRRPRIYIAKMGQDGHDRGAKVIATAFADMGYDVDIGPLFQTPEEAAQDAVDNDVHIVGMSSLAAGHKTLMPQLVEELKKRGREDIMVVIGGVIPAQDYDYLYEHGAAAIFGPGTIIPVCAKKVLEELNRRLAD